MTRIDAELDAFGMPVPCLIIVKAREQICHKRGIDPHLEEVRPTFLLLSLVEGQGKHDSRFGGNVHCGPFRLSI